MRGCLAMCSNRSAWLAAGAPTNSAPHCAAHDACGPTRPATPNRRHAFRCFPRRHHRPVVWLGVEGETLGEESGNPLGLDCADHVHALRSWWRSRGTGDSAIGGRASVSRSHTVTIPVSIVGSFSRGASHGGGANRMGPLHWADWSTPAGCHDDDGCDVCGGSGNGAESLTTLVDTSSPTLHEAVGPCPLRRLLPPTFELPVAPPPAPTIDTELEMEGAEDWPELPWSTYHPESELLAGLLSSPPAWDIDVGKMASRMLSTLPTLSPLIPSSMELWTGNASGLMMPPPPPPQPRPTVVAAVDKAAKLFMQPFVLHLPGGRAAPPALGSVGVPHSVVAEDGSSSDRRTPTSPTAVSWGCFEDDSEASSSEPVRVVASVTMNAGADVSPRVLTPSPSVSKAHRMDAEMVAKSMAVAKLPAPSKKKRSENVSARPASISVPALGEIVAVGNTLPLSVPAAAAPPPPRKRKQATFVSPVPSRFCHLCSRTAPAVRHVVCGALATSATCRKVVCDRCFSAAGPVGLGGHTFDTAVAAGKTWRCSHCVGNCPARAQCRNYTRTNERLRLARSATMGLLAAGARGGGEAGERPPSGIRCRVRARVAADECFDSRVPKAKRSRSLLAKAASFNVLMPQEPTTDAMVAAAWQQDGIRRAGTAATVAAEETARVVLAGARARPIGDAGPARTNRPRLPVSRRLFKGDSVRERAL